MKRTLVGIVLAGLYATASAQGYVGAIVGLSNYDIDCNRLSPCDKKGKAVKLYAGTQLKKGLVDTERFKLDTIEVGYIRFGGVRTTNGTRQDTREDLDTGDTIVTSRTMGTDAQANAIVLAGVGRFIITPSLTASGKLGVAYVNTTIDQTLGGASWGSETKSKLKPYLGLGIEYAVTDKLKVVGSFDYTKYESSLDGKVDGIADNLPTNQVSDATIKGSVYQLGLGVQFGF